MSRIKYYDTFHDGNYIITVEIKGPSPSIIALSRREKIITIKGKVPKIGDRVKLRINDDEKGKKLRGKVIELSPSGIPVKVLLDDGKIIEVVGYLIQLLNLIDDLIEAIKELLKKQPNSKAKIIPV